MSVSLLGCGPGSEGAELSGTETGAGTEAGAEGQSGPLADDDGQAGDSQPSADTTTATTDSDTDTSVPNDSTPFCDDDAGGGDDGDDGGGSSGGGEDTDVGMGGDIPIGASVFEIRQDAFDLGAYVDVSNLVVTTPAASVPGGYLLFVQDTQGGEYSGIGLQVSNTDPAANDVEDLTVGTALRVYAVVDGRNAFYRLVSPVEVFVQGTTQPPEPVEIFVDEFEPWSDGDPLESALVRLVDPQVIRGHGCPGEFSVAPELAVDDLFLGELAPSPGAGQSFSSITGPLRYTPDGFEVAPRTLADLQP